MNDWTIGYRAYAKPAPYFTVFRVLPSGKTAHVIDERTGDDAAFASKKDAVQCIRAMSKQQKALPA
jgi:hypothetical protein